MPNIHPFKRNRPKQEGRTYRAPWYDTTAWRALRLQHLQENPLCVSCKAKGIITPATELDHIVPISTFSEEDREHQFWHGAKQGLCHSCHSSKSGKERTTRAHDAHGKEINPNFDI